MTAPMPNPFFSVSAFVLDEHAFMVAVCNSNPLKVTADNSTAAVSKDAAAALVSFPTRPSLASDSTAAGPAIAPILEGSAAVTPILDSETNIATLLALAAIETASADRSPISKT